MSNPATHSRPGIQAVIGAAKPDESQTSAKQPARRAAFIVEEPPLMILGPCAPVSGRARALVDAEWTPEAIDRVRALAGKLEANRQQKDLDGDVDRAGEGATVARRL